MSIPTPPDNGVPGSTSGTPSRPITGAHWTKRPTHPTSARGAALSDLPDLVRYANVPRYDLTTVADFVGVRPVTLWSWDQNLGVPLLDPVSEAATGARYSERDLIALVWLREQVVNGADPVIAAQRLREALAALQGIPAPQYPLTGGPYATGARAPSRPLNSRSLHPGGDRPSQPIPRPNQPIYSSDGALAAGTPVYAGHAPEPAEQISALVRAMQLLDTRNATAILDRAFTNRLVEMTCQQLIIPTMRHLERTQSQKSEITQPEMHFAVNLFKARLFRYFDATPEKPEAPLTFVACGPSEPYELDALMLALLWRRLGVRVIYFGQNVDNRELAEEARKFRPRVVALTINATTRLRPVMRLRNDLARIDKDRAPRLAIVGSAPARDAELQRRIGGLFLGATPVDAVSALTALLRM